LSTLEGEFGGFVREGEIYSSHFGGSGRDRVDKLKDRMVIPTFATDVRKLVKECWIQANEDKNKRKRGESAREEEKERKREG
jgi:hypothetical protein